MTDQELDPVVAELQAADRFVLCTHEHPDGDALGSLAAMQLMLAALGKDAVSYMAADEFPLPYEYRFITLDRLVTEPPADLAERTIVFLDCGNIDRNPADALKGDGAHIVNIDHHHDNTRFGTVNLVDPNASSTAEMVWRLTKALGVPLTKELAEALYVGLVTDTGKFMYENVPAAKLDLLARGLANVQRFDDGALTVSHLSVADYEETGAEATYSEGVVDHLRSLEGTAVAALVRDQVGPGRDGTKKVSLRATDDRVDVSVIARAHGGGGHRRAAGFSTAETMPVLVEAIRRDVAAQLRAPVGA